MYGKYIVAALAAVGPLASAHHDHVHDRRVEALNVAKRTIDTSKIPRPQLRNAYPKRQVDTSKIPRPTFGNVPFGVDITQCTEQGKWALSFDDGPSEFTPVLLDVLKANGVKATFFVVGTMMSIWPETVQREYAEGHQVASHSWSHQDLELSTEATRQSEVLMNEAEFIDVLGFFPAYFRPPYTSCGANCIRVLSQWGYHITDYDTDTKDYEGDYTFAQNVITAAVKTGGSHISLTHDIMNETAQTFAQFIIDQAKANGYSFVTLGECLGDTPGNFYRKPTDGSATDGSGASGAGGSVTGTVLPSTSSAAASSTSSAVTTTAAATTSAKPSSSAGSGSGSNRTSSVSSPPSPTSSPSATVTQSSASRTVGAVSGLLLGVLALCLI